MGKVNLLITGKVWENAKISHILLCLVDLELMGTHAIPNVWECANSHKMEIFWGKPFHSQSMGNIKFHTMGILWGKLKYSHTMGIE